MAERAERAKLTGDMAVDELRKSALRARRKPFRVGD
jgi:hypothetical protein